MSMLSSTIRKVTTNKSSGSEDGEIIDDDFKKKRPSRKSRTPEESMDFGDFPEDEEDDFYACHRKSSRYPPAHHANKKNKRHNYRDDHRSRTNMDYSKDPKDSKRLEEEPRSLEKKRRHRDREKSPSRTEKYKEKKVLNEDLRNRLKRIEKESSSRRSTPTDSPLKQPETSKISKPLTNIKKLSSYIEVEEVDISGDEDHDVNDIPRECTTPTKGKRFRLGSNSSVEQELVSDEEEGHDTDNEKKEKCEETQSTPSDPLETSKEEAQVESPPQMEGIDFTYYFPSIEGCRSVDEFTCLNRIEEGTYGVVYRAECKRTKEIVALKRLKMEKEKEGFPITSLREINTLMKAPHDNIVRVKEIVVGNKMDKIFIVMEYVEHDLKSLMESMRKPFLLGEVKTLLLQLLSAIAHLHDNWILHRDLKTSNLLLNHRGILKVGDFGLAREYGSPLKAYTPVVVTLWYRAPELLLEAPKYSTPIDVWSIGCIFGELLTMKPFFPGKNEIDQLNLIFRDLGTPSDTIWPGYSDLPITKKVTFPSNPYNSLAKRFGPKLNKTGLDLIMRFLAYCPERRMSASAARQHDFFKENPQPIDPSMFPTWPAKSEGSTRPKVKASPKAPVGGQFADREAGLNDDILMGGYKGPGFSLKF